VRKVEAVHARPPKYYGAQEIEPTLPSLQVVNLNEINPGSVVPVTTIAV
jgi:hypothetical protein